MRRERKKKRHGIRAGAAALVLALSLGACGSAGEAKGCRNYTVQKEQYFVEYSERYKYWDVLTVEYPCLSGIDGEQLQTLNRTLYGTAMEKVHYWHLDPDEEVKELQKEYSLFCSDVSCDVSFHSQYLLSVDFHEIYAPISPVYYVHMTQRSANVNLMTGQSYELLEILRLNDEFMGLWCERAGKDYPDVIFNDEDTRETLLSWFLGEDEEVNDLYMFSRFFYITEEGDFVVGISIDPTVRTVVNNLGLSSSYSARFTEQELEPYKTDSEFWELYEKSESTGEVLECKDLQENIWLGEDAGIWDFWEK